MIGIHHYYKENVEDTRLFSAAKHLVSLSTDPASVAINGMSSFIIAWLKLFTCSALSPCGVYLFPRGEEHKMSSFVSVACYPLLA